MMDFINSLTPQQWFLIGGFIASIPGVIALTEWIKRRHLRIKTQELWSGFVILNVTVWSTLLTFVDALGANLSQITHIGSLIPQVAPYVAKYAPTLTVTVLTVHTVATALYKWWVDRQQKKALTNINLPDLSPQVQAVTSTTTVSGQPSSSLGTAAAGVDVVPVAPPANLFAE